MARKEQGGSTELNPVDIDPRVIKSLIRVIRGKQVMLDSDLAEIFEAIYDHRLADLDIKWKSGCCTLPK
ncbi:MAG: hypothetical protein II714_02130 [Oscillospiraceae bacterium]|nr:hypothetical protein [Oscillospiraceae bacterium]